MGVHGDVAGDRRVEGALALAGGLLAAWQWWQAHRLPLWPRSDYRKVRREGYARVPAFRAGPPVELIAPDLTRNS
ncbi:MULTISPECIES: hypothetical protein [Saccharothrix]|uniref:hypothetical protein n=1 Tax=Saccharothrix TaxID=2071 RepID=UPI00093FC52A|nr:hypothetical protein [Saccharothrix sp. CB00851]OKI21656.1 hypothetical protein A6A25_10305 [Saccharothrix sp. CB00851]